MEFIYTVPAIVFPDFANNRCFRYEILAAFCNHKDYTQKHNILHFLGLAFFFSVKIVQIFTGYIVTMF